MEHRDIFVSYIEEDGATARALAKELRARGYSTWTYEEDSVAGISYLTQVYQAIEACRAFVFIASDRSIRAHQVIREVEQAHERGKRIITVRLGLTHQQFIDSDPILRMASGTSVTLAVDQDVAVAAERLASALQFAPKPHVVERQAAVNAPVSDVVSGDAVTEGVSLASEPVAGATGPPVFPKREIAPEKDRIRAQVLEPPKLLSLFMHDPRLHVGLMWEASSDFTVPSELHEFGVRIFFNLYHDFIANVYFASFYVPEIRVNREPSPQIAVRIMEHIAASYQGLIDDLRSKHFAEMKGAGDSRAESTRDMLFSGRIYLYHPGFISTQQLADLEKVFRDHGAQVQVRGADYAMAVWQSIRCGDAQPPPKYEVRDGHLQLVADPK